MVSMRSDARVPVPWNTCVCTHTHTRARTYACVGRFLMRARVRRTRSSRQRWGRKGRGGGGSKGGDARAARAWIIPRARCQIARHIVKYTTPRAVGNIMFSVPFPLPLRNPSPLPSPIPDRSTFNHPRVSQPRLSTLSHGPLPPHPRSIPRSSRVSHPRVQVVTIRK